MAVINHEIFTCSVSCRTNLAMLNKDSGRFDVNGSFCSNSMQLVKIHFSKKKSLQGKELNLPHPKILQKHKRIFTKPKEKSHKALKDRKI